MLLETDAHTSRSERWRGEEVVVRKEDGVDEGWITERGG